MGREYAVTARQALRETRHRREIIDEVLGEKLASKYLRDLRKEQDVSFLLGEILDRTTRDASRCTTAISTFHNIQT